MTHASSWFMRAMKIEPLAFRGPASPRRAGTAGSPSGAFAKALADGAPAASVGGALPSGAVGAMLALQEVSGGLEARGRARRRGERLLDRLEEIRQGLLLGAIARDRLDELARMVRAGRERIDDPRLASILDEIELRAAVELAKLDRIA